MRKFLIAGALLALSGSAFAQIGSVREENISRGVERRFTDGEVRWVTGMEPLSICQKPTWVPDKSCSHVRSGSLTVGEFMRVPRQNPYLSGFFDTYYFVRLSNGQAGYASGDDILSQTSSDEIHQRTTKEKRACDQAGGVSVGMTKKQVFASCWGKPRRVNETVTAAGTSEQFVYKGGYIYLRNGIVIGIQTTRR